MFKASSAVIGSSTVTTSDVIMSFTVLSTPFFNTGLISLLEMIPIISSLSTTGRPLINSSFIFAWTSAIVESGVIVITSRIVKSSADLTFLTSSTCFSWVIFLWITPTPPSCAIAIAKSDSVTVSIAALKIGIFNLISFPNLILVSMSFGST